MTDNGYSASCPVCGYEHDFADRYSMSMAWDRWLTEIRKAAEAERVVESAKRVSAEAMTE